MLWIIGNCLSAQLRLPFQGGGVGEVSEQVPPGFLVRQQNLHLQHALQLAGDLPLVLCHGLLPQQQGLQRVIIILHQHMDYVIKTQLQDPRRI